MAQDATFQWLLQPPAAVPSFHHQRLQPYGLVSQITSSLFKFPWLRCLVTAMEKKLIHQVYCSRCNRKTHLFFFFTQYFSTTRSVHARNMHMFTCVCNRVCRCTHPHVHAWWPEVNVRCLPLSVAHILIGLDKKNPESDTVTDAKDQRSTGASR